MELAAAGAEAEGEGGVGDCFFEFAVREEGFCLS